MAKSDSVGKFYLTKLVLEPVRGLPDVVEVLLVVVEPSADVVVPVPGLVDVVGGVVDLKSDPDGAEIDPVGEKRDEFLVFEPVRGLALLPGGLQVVPGAPGDVVHVVVGVDQVGIGLLQCSSVSKSRSFYFCSLFSFLLQSVSLVGRKSESDAVIPGLSRSFLPEHPLDGRDEVVGVTHGWAPSYSLNLATIKYTNRL